MTIRKERLIMLCQNCKKNQAVFHYKSNDNGHITEKHLCSECASKEGYTADGIFYSNDPFSMIDNFFYDGQDSIFGGILGNMLGTSPYVKSNTGAVCKKCGMRYSDFSKNAKLGCPECYSTFSAFVMPTVKQIHGNTRHTGKFPFGVQQKVQEQNKLKDLKAKLEQAVCCEDYENAAKYRDEIRAIENKENNNTSKAGEA